MKRVFFSLFLIISALGIFQQRALVYGVVHNPLSNSPTPTFTQEQIFSLFKYVAYLRNLNLAVPTILEVKMHSGNEQTVAVKEVESNTRQPIAFITKTADTPYTVFSIPQASNSAALHDGNNTTFLEFQPKYMNNAAQENMAILTFKYDQPITSSQLTFDLDTNVALPDYVEMYVYQNGQRNTIITKQRLNSSVILFPQYTSAQFEVIFYYTQPLRITEVKFVETQSSYTARYVRFLARPGYTYHIFREPDGVIPYQYLSEAGNLMANNTNIQEVKTIQFVPNASYTPADQDRDGIPDATDNCISVSNSDQKNVNNNLYGDACEDFDADSVLNIYDNCPDKPNALQQDEDVDGTGDHCDGEESRLVEQYKFLPWIGIAIGFGVVILLFKLTIQRDEAAEEGDKDQIVGTSRESNNLQKK